MSWNKAGFGSRWQKKQWAILALTLLIALLLIPLPIIAKEKKSNNSSKRLPPAPDTGSPEEDFSAGGTRDDRFGDTICGMDEQQIAYLLGNRNREFTVSAHPTFWFHLPKTTNKVVQIKFVVTELETGKKIYDRVIEGTKKSAITGITLPQEKRYALSPNTNYTWNLSVDCDRTDRESEIALEGWVTRLPSQSQLQNKLAAASEVEKHAVYLRHNFLYDALTELAQRHIAQPDNIQIKIAWNQLLTKLGWQDLIEQKSATEPSSTDTQISTKKKQSLPIPY